MLLRLLLQTHPLHPKMTASLSMSTAQARLTAPLHKVTIWLAVNSFASLTVVLCSELKSSTVQHDLIWVSGTCEDSGEQAGAHVAPAGGSLTEEPGACTDSEADAVERLLQCPLTKVASVSS